MKAQQNITKKTVVLCILNLALMKFSRLQCGQKAHTVFMIVLKFAQ